jgi:hypothetical protein
MFYSTDAKSSATCFIMNHFPKDIFLSRDRKASKARSNVAAIRSADARTSGASTKALRALPSSGRGRRFSCGLIRWPRLTLVIGNLITIEVEHKEANGR